MPARLDISLQDGGRRCAVRFRSGDVDLAAGTAFTSPISPEDVESLRWLLEQHPRVLGRSTDPRAERIGARIEELGGQLGAELLGADPVAAEIARLLADDAVAGDTEVRIDAGGAWLPWEALRTPGAGPPLALRAASFVHAATEGTDGPSASPVPHDGTLRVLLVVSRPAGAADVAFRSVASRIVHAAQQARGTLVVDVLRPPTFAALQAELADAAANGRAYDVVHFDGHGVYRAGAFGPAWRGYLRFEGEHGGPDEVDGRTVGETLVRNGVRMLLLNACRSAFTGTAAGPDQAFGSLASDALAAGLGAVLAMGFNVYVVAAAQFIADTYAALGAGRSIAEAVSHARRMLARSGTFDWLVPVLHDSGLPAFTERRPDVPPMPVSTSTTTAAGRRVVLGDGLAGGPCDDRRTFYGRDDLVLTIERAVVGGARVELVGLAGSGKSATAAEFARWWCATGGDPGTAVVLDVAGCRTAADLSDAVAVQQQRIGDQPALWVLDGTHGLATWPAAERERITALLDGLAQRGARVLLVGRAPSTIPDTTLVPVSGLDAEARAELAVEVAGSEAVAAPETVPVLEWTQGNPALVRALPELLAAAAGQPLATVRRLLWDLRSGSDEHWPLLQALQARCAVEVFDVRALTSAALPFVLHLYQGLATTTDWTVFCGIADLKGLTLDAEPEHLHTELRAAQRAGLACRIDEHRYLLHPLAPACLDPGFRGTVAVLAGLDQERTRQVLTLVWSIYCQAVSAVVRMPEPAGGSATALPGRAEHRQNLWHAVDLATMAPWWGVALPLIRLLRGQLLAEGRVAEWRAVLATTLATLADFPPDPDQMGPEDLTRHLALLHADEDLVRQGIDPTPGVPVDRPIPRDPESVQLVTEDGRPVGDLAGARHFSDLMQRGDASAARGDPGCQAFYTAALETAERMHDLLRSGEAHLALGRCHRNVAQLRDFAAYERHARAGAQAGQQLGPFGADLLARGKLGVGNAIAEQMQEVGEVDPERAREARAALAFAATAPGADGGTRASARNGLGLMASLEEKWPEAAAEFLQAAAAFEALGRVDDMVVAQANAAKSFGIAGQWDDARDIAAQARASLGRTTRVPQGTLDILEAVAPEAAPTARLDALNAELEHRYAGEDLTGAITVASQVVELARATVGYTTEHYATALGDLGALFWQIGDVESALHYLALAEVAWDRTIDARGSFSPAFPTMLGTLARVYVDTGRHEEAEPVLRALVQVERSAPERAREAAVALVRLAELLNLTARPADALDCLDHARELLTPLAEPPDYDLAKCGEYRGQALLQLGDPEPARDACAAAAADYAALFGADSLDEALALNRLGQCEYALGHRERAVELFTDVLGRLRRLPVPDQAEIDRTLESLAIASGADQQAAGTERAEVETEQDVVTEPGTQRAVVRNPAAPEE